MTHVTKVYHSECYPAISPSSPVNSHHWGHCWTCIRNNTCFHVASAAKVVLFRRNHASIIAAMEKLEAIRPPGSTTQLLPYETDINTVASIEALWKDLAKDDLSVDVLILNAAAPYRGPLVNGAEQIWAHFKTNTLPNLRRANKIFSQGTEAGKLSLVYSSKRH